MLGAVVSAVEPPLPDDDEHPVTAANAMINDRVINVLRNGFVMIATSIVISVTSFTIGYFLNFIS